MSKSVLISVPPKECEEIFRVIGKTETGEAIYLKSILLRKTRPKLDTPFKCCIYMTKSNLTGDRKAYKDRMAGKVIGEFVCNEITNLFALSKFWFSDELLSDTCLSPNEIRKYANGSDKVYGWHISDLKIYDKPKELSNFYNKHCNYFYNGCCCCTEFCQWQECLQEGAMLCVKSLTRASQSWCYVEEVSK